MGGALPIKGNRWTVALGGWHGDRAPANKGAFLDFALNLLAPDVYHMTSSCTPSGTFFILALYGAFSEAADFDLETEAAADHSINDPNAFGPPLIR